MQDTLTTGRDLSHDGRRRMGALSWRWWTVLLDRLFGFVIGIILARWSGVDVYGEYVLAASIIATLVNVSDFGFTPALLIDPDRAWRHVLPVARLKLILGFLFALIAVLVALFTTGGATLVLVGLVFASEALLNVARIFQTAMMAEGRFRLAFVVTALSRSAQGAFLLCVAVIRPSVTTALLSMLVFSVLLLVLSARAYVKKERIIGPLPTRSVFSSQSNLALNQVVVHLADRFDAIVMGIVLAPSTLGLYGAAYVFFRNSRIVSSAISGVYLPEFGRWSRLPSRIRLNRTVRESIAITLVGGGILAFVLGFWAREIVTLVFGDVFAEASLVLRILAPGIPLMFLGTILANLLNGSGDTRTPLWGAGIAAASNIAGNLFFTPTYGMISAAVLTVASELINIVVLFPAARRVLQKSSDALQT